MKKKESPKELRAKVQAQKQNSIKAAEEKRRQEAEHARQEAEAKAAAARQEKQQAAYRKALEALRSAPDYKPGRKRIAKAAGLKSTFTLRQGELLMTSFGRGSEAVPEKRIAGSEVQSVAEKEALTVTPREETFGVIGRVLKTEATVDDPRHAGKTAGEDMIHCRAKLEQQYFGQTFEDNIHIQLIYNILDIEKILCVHANNIVFEINNMLRSEEAEHDDLIGYMGIDRAEQSYEKFSHPTSDKAKALLTQFDKLLHQRQMGYFGEEFMLPTPKNKASYESKKQDIYHLLAVLGMVRQATAHGEEKTRAQLFQLEEAFDKPNDKGCRREARAVLDKLYAKRVNALNKNFLDHAYRDLTLLFRALNITGDAQKKEIACAYYDFIVRKQYKNIGFSIKKLRESMLANIPKALPLTDQRYDTVRSKLYRAIDFVIYRHFQGHPDQTEALVERLRATLEEAEKELLYRAKADELWPELQSTILDHIAPQMEGSIIAAITDTHVVPADTLAVVAIVPHAHAFSEMIYLLTMFLDGKEINDLLTQLISKLDNIASFLSVLESAGLQTAFAAPYALLSESAAISQELRVINSFARMTSNDNILTKKAMFIEAAQVLGYDKSEEELEKYISNLLDKEQGLRKANGKKDNGFRNFIINNVITSDRFRYLVRYGNPKKLRAWAQNANVVRFVLAGIPDTQILRYYKSCMPGVPETQPFDPTMRDALTQMIAGISFMQFAGVHQDKGGTREQAEDKERKKASIRLYLTVLYLLQKNLVYVNSRYFLAFHCAERDGMLYDSEAYNSSVIDSDRAAFARGFLADHPPKKRVETYLSQNFANANRRAISEFRNCTEHLGALRNADRYITEIASFGSYFELYHYLVQRYLKDQFDYYQKTPSKRKGHEGEMVVPPEEAAEGHLQAYFGLVLRYHTYCKDFVKALNVAFAYNLARYKNLSINELFDRNNYLPEHGRGSAVGPKDGVHAE